MSLKDKTIVVTGGSRGLGLGMVEALVAHGARVTVVARGAEALAEVGERLAEAVRPAKLFDWQSGVRFAQEANDLFLGVSLLHRSDLHLGLIEL